jgi:hypothetical protein
MAFAGAALSGIANVAHSGQTLAQRLGSQFERDPLLWLEEKLWKWGWGLLALGFILSAVGFLLRTGAMRAINDEQAFLAQEQAIFSNLGAPALPSLSWNVGQDIGIVAGDAAKIAAWVPGEIYNGIKDVGQSIWLGLKNLPRLLWDDAAIVVGMLFGNLFDYIFPFLIVFGAIMVVVAMALRFVRSVIVPRVHIAARARFQKVIAEPLDRWFGTQAQIPAAVQERAATERVETIGGEETTAAEAAAAEQLGRSSAPEAPPAAPAAVPPPETPPPLEPPGEPPAPPEGPPEGGSEPPLPVGTPTEETEEQLGEIPYSDAKMRLRAALKAREEERSKPFAELVEDRRQEDREEARAEMRRAIEAVPAEA